MAEQVKEMVIPYMGDINMEESIRLRLAGMLPFSPEHFCFSYKKQGDQAIVQYNTDAKESISLLNQKEVGSRNKKTWFILGVLGVLVMFNFIILKIKEGRLAQDRVSRQLLTNRQYHLQKELSIAREVKRNNMDVLEKIDSFMQQPLKINSIYIDQKSLFLEAYILTVDIWSFSNYLSEKGLLKKAYFKEAGDGAWVSIKSS